jgi:RNA polymerase sigma factor (TIGR02999 family)
MARGSSEDSVTGLLRAWAAGDRDAFERLYPLVDAELRRIARHRLRAARRGGQRARQEGLDTTELIDEAVVRLLHEGRDWQNRGHFYAIAAHRMRNICADHARRWLAAKRGGAQAHEPLSGSILLAHQPAIEPEQMLDLNEALDQLGEQDPQLVQVVELRYFAGLTDREAARALGVSESTLRRDWRFARSWLYRRLRPGAASGGAPAGGADEPRG